MFSPEQLRTILDLADENFKEKEKIQRIINRLENIEKVAIGKNFVDFYLKDLMETMYLYPIMQVMVSMY